MTRKRDWRLCKRYGKQTLSFNDSVPRRTSSGLLSVISETEAILRMMEDRQAWRTLREMNGRKCASRQWGKLAWYRGAVARGRNLGGRSKKWKAKSASVPDGAGWVTVQRYGVVKGAA